jgi:hypothetical protein
MLLIGWVYFCLATALAEAGWLVVLGKLGRINRQTVENLLIIAYDVPLRARYEQALARSLPTRHEMVSHGEVQGARMLAMLNLDVREMSADKGLMELRELDLIVEREKDRYSNMKDDFDRRWARLRNEMSHAAVQDLQRQIESVRPSIAKDQLLRILDDEQIQPDVATHHVVAIFKGMTIDKRKKLIAEFTADEFPRLHDILREIRLGKPQSTLIREARQRLEQFSEDD